MSIPDLCTICMDKINNNNYCKLKCNHYFCLPCTFTQYTYKNQCPICRKIILRNKIKFKKSHFETNEIPPFPSLPSAPLDIPPPSYSCLHTPDVLVNTLMEQIDVLNDKIAALELQNNYI